MKVKKIWFAIAALLVLVAVLALGQTGFPSSIDTIANLGQPADGVSSALTSPMLIGDTVAQVANATRIPVWSVINFGGELMQVCAKSGNTLSFGLPSTACPSISGRGLSATTIAAHNTGVTGFLNINAYYHLSLSAAILAIEKWIGITSTATFNCGAYPNLNACLDAAKAYVTTANDGSARAAKIMLPSANLSLTGAPYTLVSGMQIVGTFPRFISFPFASPDYSMAPNGGTWIDCGGAQCFAGGPLTGVVLENLGFTNFTALGVFGGHDVIGMAESRIANIFAIGNPACCSSNGFTLYGPQNVDIFNVHMKDINSCWKFLADSSLYWGAGNSNAYNLFCKSYAKSVANGNSAVPIMTVQTVSGSADRLVLMKFAGITQLQSFSGDGTGTALLVDGGTTGTDSHMFDDLDIEGALLNGVRLTNYSNSGRYVFSSLAGVSTVTNGISIDATSQYNVVESHNAQVSVKLAVGNYQNLFYGMFAGFDALHQMQGDFFAGGFQSATGNAYVSQGLWLNTYGTATSGTDNRGCAPANFLSSLWTGSAGAGDLWSMFCVPGTGTSPYDDLYLTHAGSASGGTLRIYPPTAWGASQALGFNVAGDFGKAPGGGLNIPQGNGQLVLEAAGIANPTDIAIQTGSTSTPLSILKNGSVQLPVGGSFYAGFSQGITTTKTAGACTFTISGGLITAVAGC